MKDLKIEIIRKIFHFFTCVSTPIFLYFFEINFLKIALIHITILMFIFDFFNLYEILPKNPFIDFLTGVARSYERKKYTISAMTWAFLAFTILLILNIDKKIIGLSFVILGISDTFSAFIGIRFGRIKIFTKSLEGFVAFFISALLICVIYFKTLNMNINITIPLFACLLTSMSELFAKKIKIDDNFLIPVVFCFSYEVFSSI